MSKNNVHGAHLDTANEKLAVAHRYFGHGKLAAYQDPREKAYTAFRAALTRASGVSVAAYLRAINTREDDTLPVQALNRQLRENHTNARVQASEAFKAADAALEALTREARNAALPDLDAAREGFTRDDARMVLDAAVDADSAMLELARRGGNVAALVASQWGADYLRSRGVAQPSEAHKSVVDAAVDSNPGRARDAYVYGLRAARQGRQITEAGSNNLVEDSGLNPAEMPVRDNIASEPDPTPRPDAQAPGSVVMQ